MCAGTRCKDIDEDFVLDDDEGAVEFCNVVRASNGAPTSCQSHDIEYFLLHHSVHRATHVFIKILFLILYHFISHVIHSMLLDLLTSYITQKYLFNHLTPTVAIWVQLLLSILCQTELS